MMCPVCDLQFTRDEVPVRVFGELIHPTCDIIDIAGKTCQTDFCMWKNTLHSGECY